MKRHIFLCLLTFLLVLPAFAQKNGKHPSHQEMMQFKMEFLAKEMELREDQKKQFNEVYLQMEQDRRSIFKKMKEAEKKINSTQNATEADYEKASQEISTARQQMSAIESNYDKKFEKFLSKKQIFKMKEAENKFNERMRHARDDKKKGKKPTNK